MSVHVHEGSGEIPGPHTTDRQLDAGYYAAAAKFYARGFALDPDMPDASRRYGYALALSKLGRRGEAVEQVKISLRINPAWLPPQLLLKELGG